MKRKMFVLSLFLLPLVLSAQVIPVKTELKGVKVFLSGAELYHTAKARLEKGNSEILFENVASDFDINSVSVTGKGNFIITSIGQQYDYLKNSVKPTEMKVLEDSLEILEIESRKKQDARSILSMEEDLIMKNGSLSGRQTNVTPADVQKYAEFMKKRISEIKKEIIIVTGEGEKIRKRMEQMRRQLQELNNKYSQAVNQISVNVTANSAVNAEFEITYLTHSASWIPVYDARVDDISKPIKLSYTAKVSQNTGLVWKDLKILLSSRNPNVSQTKPELYPWYLNFRTAMKKMASGVVMQRNQAFDGKVAEMKMEAAAPEAESVADYTTVNENMLSFEFESSIPYTIPSDMKPHSVSLKDYQITTNYEYWTAPKFDPDAFLVGFITNWNEYNLLPGEVNSYFQNSFVGKTYLDPNVSKDTLILSLGRDRGITTERKPIKDFTEDKFLSSDIERFFAYDIIVKNNKNKQVKVTVEDQLPVSKNEDITVKAIELSGGVVEGVTGKVKWNITVDPGKSVTKRFVFSVRHPKDQAVSGL